MHCVGVSSTFDYLNFVRYTKYEIQYGLIVSVSRSLTQEYSQSLHSVWIYAKLWSPHLN